MTLGERAGRLVIERIRRLEDDGYIDEYNEGKEENVDLNC